MGVGSFSKVVATFIHVNLFMATTGDVWIIPSFQIWGYALYVDYISCVISYGDLKFKVTSGFPLTKIHKYSLLMQRIKIKSPTNFLWNEQHVFVCWFITFQSVLLWRYYDKKAYRILAVLPFKMSAAWLPWDSPWSLVSTPWAMSFYFKFLAIYFWLLNEY